VNERGRISSGGDARPHLVTDMHLYRYLKQTPEINKEKVDSQWQYTSSAVPSTFKDYVHDEERLNAVGKIFQARRRW